jgi:hypothetical protein
LTALGGAATSRLGRSANGCWWCRDCGQSGRNRGQRCADELGANFSVASPNHLVRAFALGIFPDEQIKSIGNIQVSDIEPHSVGRRYPGSSNLAVGYCYRFLFSSDDAKGDVLKLASLWSSSILLSLVDAMTKPSAAAVSLPVKCYVGGRFIANELMPLSKLS